MCTEMTVQVPLRQSGSYADVSVQTSESQCNGEDLLPRYEDWLQTLEGGKEEELSSHLQKEWLFYGNQALQNFHFQAF